LLSLHFGKAAFSNYKPYVYKETKRKACIPMQAFPFHPIKTQLPFSHSQLEG
jgi:hypothetical protein